MLSVIYAESCIQGHFAECRYAECRYAECRGAVQILLNFVTAVISALA